MKLCKHKGCVNKATYGNQCQPCRNSIQRYGITTPEKLEMLKRQHNACALCHINIEFDGTSNNAVIDHCHTHGHIRGILCANCNTYIGYVENKNISPIDIVSYLS